MQLVRYDAARTALAEARRVDEVKDIRDKAQALAAYARQARDTEMIQWATEIKVRAERRCGEMLKAMEERGERATADKGRKAKASHDTTLSDLGITRDQSSRYQKLADMPEEHFETAVATAKQTAGEVTTAAMLRLAQSLQKNQELKEELAEFSLNARWRVLRRRLEDAVAALDELRKADTPTCDPEEGGKIMLAMQALAAFIGKEIGYGVEDPHRHHHAATAQVCEGLANRAPERA